MAAHQIAFTQSTRDVQNTDLTFVIRQDGKKLGELQISRGSIDWKPSRCQSAYAWSWEKFARTMEGR